MQQAKNFALQSEIDLLLSSPRTVCLGYEKKHSLGQFRVRGKSKEGKERKGNGKERKGKEGKGKVIQHYLARLVSI